MHCCVGGGDNAGAEEEAEAFAPAVVVEEGSGGFVDAERAAGDVGLLAEGAVEAVVGAGV